jgi:LmbE family N-acetylglucosaminyl deacetylase
MQAPRPTAASTLNSSDHRGVLAVYAHPDDEAFTVAGVFRKARDEGIRPALICATRGEGGIISHPSLATPATLGQVRERELREACDILGVDDLTFLDYRDGSLPDVDRVQAVGKIVYHIRRLRPRVVVTFDANGDYGHRDHMAIHRLTVAAFQAAGDPACYPEQLDTGVSQHAPSKLYAHAMPWSIMRRVYHQVEAKGGTFRPGGSTATIAPREMGTPDEEITTVVKLEPWHLAAKVAALRAHRTQAEPDGPFNRFPSGAVREWLEVERFKLLYPLGALGVEDNLFADAI